VCVGKSATNNEMNFEMNNFLQLRERNKKWFEDIQLFIRFVGHYEYFGTFRFRQDHEMTWDQAQKSIAHFKGVVRKKLFGKHGDFKLNFLSVIEDEKWEKHTKQYVAVKTHFHFLISDPPIEARLNKDFPNFLVDCWCSLQEADERDKQQVKLIYSGNSLAEDYITKLRRSSKGIKFLDVINSTQSQPITDGFWEFYEEIKEKRKNTLIVFLLKVILFLVNIGRYFTSK